MTDKDLPSASPRDERTPIDLEQRSKLREQVFGNLVEKLKPWLLEFGNWIFGGLIAFNLLIVATLINVGPVRPVLVVASAIFACVLPVNVLGLFSVKLVTDMNNLLIDDVVKQAFQEANIFDVEERFPTPAEKATVTKRRTDVGLRYSVRLAVLSAILTTLGIVAVLSYLAWWVAVIFFVMVILSLVIAMNIVGQLMRPETAVRKH